MTVPLSPKYTADPVLLKTPVSLKTMYLQYINGDGCLRNLHYV